MHDAPHRAADLVVRQRVVHRGEVVHAKLDESPRRVARRRSCAVGSVPLRAQARFEVADALHYSTAVAQNPRALTPINARQIRHRLAHELVDGGHEAPARAVDPVRDHAHGYVAAARDEPPAIDLLVRLDGGV